jgi:hypothetical protein
MPAAIMFNQFPEDLGKAVHNFTSDATCTPTLALCNAANIPLVTNSILANLTTISHTNLSSRVVTGITWEQTGGVVNFTGNDLLVTASGTVPAFRYAALYNDDPTSPADPLILFWDIGQEINLTSGMTYLFDIVSVLGQLRQGT